MLYASFHDMFEELLLDFRLQSQIVHTERWQGVDISRRPEMATHELRHVFLEVPMRGDERLVTYQSAIKPNLPWADNHFLERVCGQPINPGVEWKNWPYAHSAERFLDQFDQFNHNYMERYWPKKAGCALFPTLTAEEFAMAGEGVRERYGIRHQYGDLTDVVCQLVREPQTRQAILPVFFPEDTGAAHGGRVPCTIYYQFLIRNRQIDVVYAIRSCDLVRHFRDDIYLTIRLLLWVLDECRKLDAQWKTVRPGKYVMMITSLHCFRNDFIQLFGAPK